MKVYRHPWKLPTNQHRPCSQGGHLLQFARVSISLQATVERALEMSLLKSGSIWQIVNQSCEHAAGRMLLPPLSMLYIFSHRPLLHAKHIFLPFFHLKLTACICYYIDRSCTYTHTTKQCQDMFIFRRIFEIFNCYMK